MSQSTTSGGYRKFLMLFCLLCLLPGCCPYTKGLIADVTGRTSLPKTEAFDYLQNWFNRSGYRIWQKDEVGGYIRASIVRESTRQGSQIEDVLAATLKDRSGRVELEIQAETYEIGSRRVKVKVSAEAKRDITSLKDGLARGAVAEMP